MRDVWRCVKSAFAVFVSLTIAFPVWYMPAFVSAEDEPAAEASAKIDFDKSKTDHITRYAFLNSMATPVRKNGRTGYSMTVGETDYLLIDVDDSFMYSEKETDFILSVDYFDSGKGTFTLRYSDGASMSVDHTDIVKLENTGEWKTHDFYISEGTLDNRVMSAGYDIAVATWSLLMGSSPEPVIIGKVEIKKLPPKLVTTEIINSDKLGNIFDIDEFKELKLKLINNYESEVTADIVCKTVDLEGDVLEQESKQLTFTDAGECTYAIKAKKYGAFKAIFDISARSADGEILETSESVYFSIVDKFEAGEPKNKMFGVSSHPQLYYTEEVRQREMREVVDQSGIGVVRLGARWQLVEAEKGKYSMPAFTDVIPILQERNINPLVIFGGNMSGAYGDSAAFPTTDASRTAYVNFVKYVLNSPQGKEIKTVEILNEPNFTTLPASAYTEVMKAVYPVIKELRPDINVIGGVLGMVPYSWMTDFFESGGLKYLDTLSIHPYDFDGEFKNKRLREDMQNTRSMMNEYGGAYKNLWITELGWTTATKASSGVAEKSAAAYAVQSFTMIKAEKLADLTVWYDLENDGDNPAEQEPNFGLLRRSSSGDVPWAAKLPYVSVVNMNHYFAQSEYIGGYRPSDESAVYHFSRDNGEKDFVVAWSNFESRMTSVNLNTPYVEVYDMYGNKLYDLQSDNGIYSIGLNESPIYIVGDISDISEQEGDISIENSCFYAIPGEEVIFEVTDKKNRPLTIITDIEQRAEEDVNEDEEVGSKSLQILKNENGKLIFSATAGDTDKHSFNVDVYAGEKLVYKGECMLTPIEPIEISTDVYALNENCYKLKVSVKNLSSKQPVSGVVRVTESEKIATAANIARIVDLKPDETQVYEIRLPQMIRKRMETINAEVTLDSGYAKSYKKNFGFTSAAYAVSKPVIDGKLDSGEWKGSQFIGDRESDIFVPSAMAAKGIKWGGKSDLSYSGTMMWDEENMYLALDVEDNVFFQDGTETNIWRGDSVQFGITTPGESQFNEVGAALTPEGEQIYSFSTKFGIAAGLISNGEFKVSRIDERTGHMIYELAVPWKSLLGVDYSAAEGNEILFSILANDNDGEGRKAFMQFGRGVGTEKNSDLFVKIELKK